MLVHARASGPVVTVALSAVLLGACDDDPGPEEPPEEHAADEEDDDPVALDASCENEELEVRVDYPDDWHVNADGPLPACSAFDPEPIDLPEDTEVPTDVAIVLRGEPTPFEEYDPAEDPTIEVHSSDPVSVDGRDAEILEIESTGDGLHSPGLLTHRYHVDLGDALLIAETHDAGTDDDDFEARRGLLDAMMDRLEFIAPATREDDD